jgi:hypothetical protein
VRTVLDDLAMLQHVDAVGGPQAREAMRDQQDRASGREFAYAIEELVLRARVERGRRLVQDDEGSAAEKGASQRDALPLADGQLLPALEDGAQHGVIALWQRGTVRREKPAGASPRRVSASMAAAAQRRTDSRR